MMKKCIMFFLTLIRHIIVKSNKLILPIFKRCHIITFQCKMTQKQVKKTSNFDVNLTYIIYNQVITISFNEMKKSQ
ncbi:hypothetical protein FGO68_gene12980 [Halteria grandinella]|uniref:Uncharacterized protein n=1 Tax=Halteria grandinella TaxID=5974 RepID=A0A8J8NHG5_HALGN|nr:hypothetical protein FGO68_gene12980 [Halteria grandinella]